MEFSNKIRNHEDLEVWQLGMNLVKEVYLFTEKLPDKEKFRLVDQMCRAVVSIPSNIAEGISRKSRKEFMRFLSIAIGSLAELKTQLIICVELRYATPEHIMTINEITPKLGKNYMLYMRL